jgi:hypothetical protein
MGTRIEHCLVQPRVVTQRASMMCTKIPLPMILQRLHGLNCPQKKENFLTPSEVCITNREGLRDNYTGVPLRR